MTEFASEQAAEVAKEAGLSDEQLQEIEGTGKDGALKASDIKAYVESNDSSGEQGSGQPIEVWNTEDGRSGDVVATEGDQFGFYAKAPDGDVLAHGSGYESVEDARSALSTALGVDVPGLDGDVNGPDDDPDSPVDPEGVASEDDEDEGVAYEGEVRPIETVHDNGDWVDPFSGLRVYHGSDVCEQSGARRVGDEAVLERRF